jgi:hypothetical protein
MLARILTHILRILVLFICLIGNILLLLRVFGFIYLMFEQVDPLLDPFNVLIVLAHLLGEFICKCLLFH